jgi:hypothetical protein
MKTFTYSEALQETRKIARELGMTFKKQRGYINGKQAYMLINRQSGEELVTNMTLWNSYENALSGYFDKIADKYNTK